MRGLRTSIWPWRNRWALLSVGLPPRRTKIAGALHSQDALGLVAADVDVVEGDVGGDLSPS